MACRCIVKSEMLALVLCWFEYLCNILLAGKREIDFLFWGMREYSFFGVVCFVVSRFYSVICIHITVYYLWSKI